MGFGFGGAFKSVTRPFTKPLMGILGVKTPTIPELPVAPDPAIAAAAAAAEQRAAALEQETYGRRSTIVAGASIAAEEQQARVEDRRKKRLGAAMDVLG